MNIFKTNKILNRLDNMIEDALSGNFNESSFDESKLSMIESKFKKYILMRNATHEKILKDKLRVNELISDISHQTKTPIANILLYSQLLSEQSLSPEDSLCIDELTAQAEKLNFLITSLIKSSRLENGIITVNPTLQPIENMILDVIKQVRPTAESKNIDINHSSSDIIALFDYKWTSEALYNIIDNAVKYTPPNGNISVSAISYQLFCRIDITDTGIGISQEDFTKIFSRFYRAENVSDIKGVGIGLYISREIISKENGYIKVSSTLKKGSTFSIFLPLKNSNLS